MKKIILVLSVIGLILVVFNRSSTINANLMQAHIEVSDNFIKGIALHGNLYMEQDTVRDSEYFPMDIDHFKKVNDTWGHSTGDDLLRQIAGIAAKKLRDTDILIRYGGEEFLIVTPQTSNEGARVVAEKIRSAIEEFHHPVAGTKTASFGVSERMSGESFDHWYHRVDEALYLAKNEGRNRVIVSETSLA